MGLAWGWPGVSSNKSALAPAETVRPQVPSLEREGQGG